MSKYVVEYLIETRFGLADRELVVRATSVDAARAIAEAKYPNAAIGFVGLVSA